MQLAWLGVQQAHSIPCPATVSYPCRQPFSPANVRKALNRKVCACWGHRKCLQWQPTCIVTAQRLVCCTLQIRCRSESTQEKTEAPIHVTKPLQSTDEERQRPASKHQILNVAESDLEGDESCSMRAETWREQHRHRRVDDMQGSALLCLMTKSQRSAGMPTSTLRKKG